MILYRLFEINDEYVEVIGLYQDRDIAQKTISILPKKPYECIYGIDAVDIHSMDVLNRVIYPYERKMLKRLVRRRNSQDNNPL